jgi:hypothetical protein
LFMCAFKHVSLALSLPCAVVCVLKLKINEVLRYVDVDIRISLHIFVRLEELLIISIFQSVVNIIIASR